jgi:hypothetical protein
MSHSVPPPAFNDPADIPDAPRGPLSGLNGSEGVAQFAARSIAALRGPEAAQEGDTAPVDLLREALVIARSQAIVTLRVIELALGMSHGEGGAAPPH